MLADFNKNRNKIDRMVSGGVEKLTG